MHDGADAGMEPGPSLLTTASLRWTGNHVSSVYNSCFAGLLDSRSSRFQENNSRSQLIWRRGIDQPLDARNGWLIPKNNVTRSSPALSNVDMAWGQTVTLYFHRDDARRESVPLTRFTVLDAKAAIREILSISDGAYTKAEIYKGKQLIETVENTASVAQRRRKNHFMDRFPLRRLLPRFE